MSDQGDHSRTEYWVIWPGHLWVGGFLLFALGLVLGLVLGVLVG